MTLAEKLNSLRTESGLSQSTLAEQMGVTRQTVSRWETGEAVPTGENLRRLGELYGVSVGYLLNDSMESPTAVAVAEKPEPEKRWWKPALIGIIIALAMTLAIVVSFSIGYDKGVEDTKPTYSVHTDTLNEENLEGGIDIKPLSTPPANVLGEEGLEGTFDLTQ